jgi:DnaJ family protein A protein 5
MSLMRKFHNNIPFDDEPTGFFGIARDTFEHLALEEEAAAEAENLDVLDYPSFGFSDDKYDEVVKPFYSIWAGFATKKPFFWKDKYRLSDAPDRKVRRLMEKENKKLRDEAAREFNDAVRFLVTFVRKRDPRYTLNFKSQADRVESARNAAAAQAARSRAANQELLASYETPDWARSRGDDESEDHFALTEDESEVEILECVICSKSFKSEKQLQAHERSKKHLKATANLRRQMRKEGVELDLDQDIPSSRPCDLPDAAVNDELTCETLSRPSIHASEPPEEDIESHDSESQRPESSASSQLTDGGDYASRGEVLDRLALGSQETAHPIGGSDALEGETLCERTQDLVLDSELPQKKKGKARAKRERKAAASLAADTSVSFTWTRLDDNLLTCT